MLRLGRRPFVSTMLLVFAVHQTCHLQADEKNATKALDTFITEGIKQWSVTGMAVAVVKDGKVVFMRGYGIRHIRTGEPVDQDTVFQLGSCTKPLTATLFAKLVSDGTLQWDSLVKDMWPGFNTIDKQVTEQATLRDILCHRTGIGKNESALYYEMPINRDELLARLPEVQQVAAFRSEWRYSNLMYLAAGRAVDSRTNNSWDELLQQRLLRPLGMSRTITASTALRGTDNVAIPHVRTAEGTKTTRFADQDAVGPAASVCSSVNDLSKWLLLLTHGGAFNGDRLIRPDCLEELTKPQIPMSFSDPVLGEYSTKTYGLGLMVFDYHGRNLALHPGMAGHSMAIVGFVPHDGVGAVVLTNYRPSLLHYAVFRRAIDLYCGEEPIDLDAANRKLFDEHVARQSESLQRRATTRVPDTKPTLPIQDYVGNYEHEFGLRASLSLAEKQLILRYGHFVADVEHWNGDTFQARLCAPRLPAEQNWYLTFTVEQGRIKKLHIHSEHDVDADFLPVSKARVTEGAAQLPHRPFAQAYRRRDGRHRIQSWSEA